MAKNDRILLDGIIDDRINIRLPSDDRGEAFEYLALEQILKEFDFSGDEILSGLIDGGRDGGIDGFYILVNGHLLQDTESFVWPRIGSDLKIFIVSCKHHDAFRQATLDAIIATLTEILDFKIEDNDLKGAYSQPLLKMRNNLKFAYRKLSPHLASFSVEIYYASRGNTEEIGAEVQSRGNQIENMVKDYFGSCDSKFKFFGCTELVELHRKIPNYTLELPFVEALTKGERYVVLAKLPDYYNFISEDGKLRRYLFESNVRDFMGLNNVNEDIKDTLENKESPDFWWLNNGVTILATAASIVGKSIQVADIQIVNGLQTTESIFRHFSSNPNNSDDRCVLVKVIVSKEELVRDSIIRATNNQTNVELASLHATDKVQRDIEDVMVRHGLFYERRKNFYLNQGHIPAEIITPLYIAAAYVALVLKLPNKSATLRSKFMRSAEFYEMVFSEQVNIQVWPKIARIHKMVDFELEALRPTGKKTENFLKGWRYIISFVLVSEILGKYTFTVNDLINFDVSAINANRVKNIWEELTKIDSPPLQKGSWTNWRNVLEVCKSFSSTKNISGIEMLLRQSGFINLKPSVVSSKKVTITKEFLDRVQAVVPPQPWKPGVHLKLLKRLGCDVQTYQAAINMLIRDGIFYKQKDGVLYDKEGNVVSFDADRVDPVSLALIKKAV